MADFFDRLLAKSASAPVARAADGDGVRSAAAQPRLPHPFERPGTAGDLEWTEQPSSESEYSRRGNAMEHRSEPAFGTRAAGPALPRSEDRAVTRSRPDSRSSTEPGLGPLLVVPAAAEQPLPRSNPPTLPIAASQSSSRLTAARASADSPASASASGSPADRAPATAMPTSRQASAQPAPTPRARLAERGAPPAQRAATAPQPPSVTVRIGRLEVRAATPAPAGPASRPDRRTREPALKLDEYLAREGGRR
ncbi:hypothetical protein [Catenulispora rubra]|uniref:hypothetical protein n=1 Tax=Catenulispora rubra TaxID=280293 RepID=UPI0018920395|nr:hypothetical protein [Catenulispora rubra]